MIAHSVASIIASLAAQADDSPIETILSLEDNLTAADVYFTGMAVEHDDPGAFHETLISRLEGMAATKLEGVSHWPTLDAPDRVAAAVLDVLR